MMKFLRMLLADGNLLRALHTFVLAVVAAVFTALVG
jgi:hypothetical protein